MRNCILLLIFVGITCFACRKNETGSKEIIGTWNWVKQTNDTWPPQDVTPQNTGVSETVIFQSANTYHIARNGTQVESGTFTSTSFTSTTGEKSKKIIFHRGFGLDSVDYYKVSGNSLNFSLGYAGSAGSGIRFYERQ